MFEEAPPLKVWAYPIVVVFSIVLLFLLLLLFRLWTIRQGVGAIKQKSGKGLDRNYPRYFRNIDCDSWVFLNGTRVVRSS